MSRPDDAPALEAWLDTDGEGDQLHVRVTDDGTVYEESAVDLETLLQTEQFIESLSRPALTLLSLWERRVTAGDEVSAEEFAHDDLEDVEAD